MTWTINVVASILEIDAKLDAAQPEGETHEYVDRQVTLAKKQAKEQARLAARGYSQAVVTVNIVGHGDEEDVSPEANFLQVTTWSPNHADDARSKAEINAERAEEARLLTEDSASFDPEDVPPVDVPAEE